MERVGAEICHLAGQIAAATSRFLSLLADFDARKGWKGANVTSCAHWLSWKCGLDPRTAREHVRVARALTQLPKIRNSFDAGRISYSKVRAIARVATPASEVDLLETALHSSAADVERLTRGLRTAQKPSPEPNDEGLNPPPNLTPPQQITWRWDYESGELVLNGRLNAADGAGFWPPLRAHLWSWLVVAPIRERSRPRRTPRAVPRNRPSKTAPQKSPAPTVPRNRRPPDRPPMRSRP